MSRIALVIPKERVEWTEGISASFTARAEVRPIITAFGLLRLVNGRWEFFVIKSGEHLYGEGKKRHLTHSQLQELLNNEVSQDIVLLMDPQDVKVFEKQVKTHHTIEKPKCAEKIIASFPRR